MAEHKTEACPPHDWEVGTDGWGVVLGVSRCKKCGKVARADDFAPAPLEGCDDV
jgi:hypothetical protein